LLAGFETRSTAGTSARSEGGAGTYLRLGVCVLSGNAEETAAPAAVILSARISRPVLTEKRKDDAKESANARKRAVSFVIRYEGRFRETQESLFKHTISLTGFSQLFCARDYFVSSARKRQHHVSLEIASRRVIIDCQANYYDPDQRELAHFVK